MIPFTQSAEHYKNNMNIVSYTLYMGHLPKLATIQLNHMWPTQKQFHCNFKVPLDLRNLVLIYISQESFSLIMSANEQSTSFHF